MLPEKTNISARVDLTLKKIVEESTFNHKDAYELGAKLIAIGDAEETIEIIDSDPVLQKLIKQNEKVTSSYCTMCIRIRRMRQGACKHTRRQAYANISVSDELRSGWWRG